MRGVWIGLAMALAVAGCATAPTGPKIDTKTYRSQTHESRARFIVLHFTALDFDKSVQVLTKGAVSSHYLIGDDPKAKIYLLVDEERRARHAGISSWRGETLLNSASIGIEIVNLGGSGVDPAAFAPFSDEQITQTVALVKDIARRHQVAPHRIVAHGEIAPTRRVDPGPRFPWRRLFEEGLIPWPADAAVAAAATQLAGVVPDAVWLQDRLTRHGFGLERSGVIDAGTTAAVKNFQMRYRPSKPDGVLDLETAALLMAATEPGGLEIRGPDGALTPYEPKDR
jgi:N-acetylmuramoyl-L-alanine amidase